MTRRGLFARALAVAAGLAAAGCGGKDDNSKVQTPNDQPIGAPEPAGKGDGPARGKGRTGSAKPER